MSARPAVGPTRPGGPEGPAGFDGDSACSGGESFALRVLGDDMAPEFNDGEIIIVEPDGALKDGSFVLARHEGEWIFRQLCRRGAGWVLHALNPARADLRDLPLPDLGAVHGVVIQKAVPGRRRLSKFYV
jgi:SOS-response transcriptional repressor LexA